MSKSQETQNWLNGSFQNLSFGHLHLIGNVAYTYDVPLAWINRDKKEAAVNVTKYSVTSSKHRNQILAALKAQNYSISEVTEFELQFSLPTLSRMAKG